jgi:hypothetical protein
LRVGNSPTDLLLKQRGLVRGRDARRGRGRVARRLEPRDVRVVALRGTRGESGLS